MRGGPTSGAEKPIGVYDILDLREKEILNPVASVWVLELIIV
jgi:hypothetical protein